MIGADGRIDLNNLATRDKLRGAAGSRQVLGDLCGFTGRLVFSGGPGVRPSFPARK
jgi:hypothetical protein